MANEIWNSYDEAGILYAIIWDKDTAYPWHNTGEFFDTDGYIDANIAQYSVPLTNHADSDYHTVDFPAAITAGVYRVQIMLQDSAVPDTPHADDDLPVAQGEIYWNGKNEISASDYYDKVLNVYNET